MIGVPIHNVHYNISYRKNMPTYQVLRFEIECKRLIEMTLIMSGKYIMYFFPLLLTLLAGFIWGMFNILFSKAYMRVAYRLHTTFYISAVYFIAHSTRPWKSALHIY